MEGTQVRTESSGAILSAYLPHDRRLHIAGTGTVAERATGCMLFADVSGFTTLTTRLTEKLGLRRGAEEVPRYLNRLYDALIGEVERRSGSVIGFAGDAITCWFADDDGSASVACAVAMQEAMVAFEGIRLGSDPNEEPVSLSVKISLSRGEVRRFVVGDPEVQLLDVVAGDTVARLEPLNEVAASGEIVIDQALQRTYRGPQRFRECQAGNDLRAFVLIKGPPRDANEPAAPRLAASPAATVMPSVEQLEPWLLPTVQRQVEVGQGEFLTELRPVAALFMAFDGIDYDHDDEAPRKLDALIRWVQHEASVLGANLLQLTIGDKGSYLYLACGAPVTHGDDVHRCAAAALRLRQAVTAFEFLDDVRIGLGFGTARTGAYGSTTRRTYGALGIQTNLAARLMGVAGNSQAYASDEFVRACQDAFSFAPMQPRLFKGSNGPVPVFELLAHVGAKALTDDDQGVPHLVGRDQELAMLSEALMGARLGRGTVVQLTAGAGMGKSRLIGSALSVAGGSDLEVLFGAGRSYAGAAPYRAWGDVIHGVLGLDPHDSAAARITSLLRALDAIDPALRLRAPLLAPVLDLQLEESILVASMSPELRQASRQDLLLTLLRQRATSLAALGRTMVVVIEDLHATDTLSRELLEAFARLVPDLPVALLTAGRPSSARQTANAQSRTQSDATLYLMGATQVLLAPLKHEEAEQLLAERLRGTDFLPDENLVAEIIERAEGNPFFLEVLLAEVVARAEQSPGRGTGELPTNLHSLVLARLDRLTEQQQANLKVAGVIGREFQARWVHACLRGRSPAAVVEDLEVTRRQDLTPLVEREPLTYRFDHSITRDVVYESLPHELQRELHTRIAQHIEHHVADADDQQLDLLAFHYDRSHNDAKRREYLWRAGRAAQENYAQEAAVAYYTRLLPLLAGSERLEPLLALGEVSSFIGDHTAAEGHLREALATAESASDSQGRARAQRLLGELFERRGEHVSARDWLEQAVRSSRELGEPIELTKVLLALGGNALWHLGIYPEASQLLLEAQALAEENGDLAARARALHGLANIDLYRGEVESAERRYQHSLALRRECGDELGVANSLNNLGIVAANAGREAEAADLFRQSLDIRRRLGDVSGVAVALNNLGFMASEDGRLDEAKALFEQSLTLRREIGDELGNAVCLNNLADVARRQGDEGDARHLYRQSLELAHRIGNQREAATALIGLAATEEVKEMALQLATFAETLMSSLGATLDREVQATLDSVLALATTSLGDPAVDNARTTAIRRTFGGMVEDALAATASPGV